MTKFHYYKLSKNKKIRYLKHYQKNHKYIVFLHGFMSDLEGEKPKKFLNFAKKNNFPANVIRLFQVYGPNQGDSRAVTQLMKYCIKDKIFPASDGKQVRDFCFIDDVVQAINLLLKKRISGKIINVGFGTGVSMKKLIFSIQYVAKGGRPKLGLFKSRNHENPRLIPSILLAKKLLNWQPKTKLIQGLKKTKNFLVKHEK